MTRVAGMSVGRNRQGRPIQDGGAAIVEDGEIIVAISEERLNREKYSPGFAAALEYCLDSEDLSVSDIDAFVFSNCLGYPLTPDLLDQHVEESDVDIPWSKRVICDSHHRSHAASALFTSTFDDALIFSIDNTGNVLRGDYGRHHLNGLERTSIFYGDGTEIRLDARYHDECSELGLGAAYKYVTLYLGFRSYKDAGKVMGLAAYGDGDLAEYRLFDDDWNCLIESNPYDRAGAVRQCLVDQGFDPGPRKEGTDSTSSLQKEIAWLLQRELERVLVEMVEHHVERTGCQTLCYAGGVALNCVANTKLLRETPLERLHIPPAPGDYGQCIGNALYGYHIYRGNRDRTKLKNTYLGRPYSDEEIEAALHQTSADIVSWQPESVERFVAEAIADGNIVGHFAGGSEFGPRALGNRSILGDPRQADTRDYVNDSVKFRESYRPFAPTVLRERYTEYFESKPRPSSKFMLLAQPVKAEKQDEIPAVVHANGTARLQTVSSDENPRFHAIISEFDRLTGTPLVLNTSFNLSGEPIVETPSDALSTFRRSGLDYLVLNEYVISDRDDGDE